MNTSSLSKQIILKNKEERRIISGHPWVFSNEIRETRGGPIAGDITELFTAAGKSLGIGMYNPHSLIAWRMLSSSPEPIDQKFFVQRFNQALALRKALYPESETYRLVHGESDFLPGLIIDRYNDYIALQTFSFGMEQRLSLICDGLEELFQPSGIVARNESSLRLLENLPQEKRILRGSVKETQITENGVVYKVDPLNGQKTGLFLDQRENHRALRRFSKGASVLDCFCNDGGFSLNASVGGAMNVLGIDASQVAVDRATTNAALNRFANVKFEQGDVFEELKELQDGGKTFDVIILDPPSFTKSRKNVHAAKKGYKELNTRALGLLNSGGILITASCSHHILPEVFLDIVTDSARKSNRSLQLLDWRGAAPDHPVLPSVPETHYLKLGVFRVL